MEDEKKDSEYGGSDGVSNCIRSRSLGVGMKGGYDAPSMLISPFFRFPVPTDSKVWSLWSW